MDTVRGALVHFSEEMFVPNVYSTTPWIALISCEVTAEKNESTIERESVEPGSMSLLDISQSVHAWPCVDLAALAGGTAGMLPLLPFPMPRHSCLTRTTAEPS
jgi:hypothetical protein